MFLILFFLAPNTQRDASYNQQDNPRTVSLPNTADDDAERPDSVPRSSSSVQDILDKAQEVEDEWEDLQQGADNIMNQCDKAHAVTQETLNRSFTNNHEIGGDGDAAMGSETSHLKRKADGNQDDSGNK